MPDAFSSFTDTPSLPPAQDENYVDFIIEYRNTPDRLPDPSIPHAISVIDDRYAVLYVPRTYLMPDVYKRQAHSSSRKSPALMEKPSVIHRKYMPCLLYTSSISVRGFAFRNLAG